MNYLVNKFSVFFNSQKICHPVLPTKINNTLTVDQLHKNHGVVLSFDTKKPLFLTNFYKKYDFNNANYKKY